MKERGLLRREINALYSDVYKKIINPKRFDTILSALVSTGLIREEPYDNDHRLRIYFAQVAEERVGPLDTGTMFAESIVLWES